MQLVSGAEAATRRYFMSLPNGIGNWVTSYMGTTPAEARARGQDIATGSGGPVAYLVEQSAGSSVAGHYHQVDEFQLFVASDGAFGSTPLSGLHLHYAAAFTPYAPISAGRELLRYFTLRRGFDPGAQWMPESKDRLLAHKRPFRAHVAPVRVEAQAAGTASVTVLMEPDASGIGAWVYGLGAGASVQAPAPRDGGGEFLLVLEGGCTIDGADAARFDIAHLDAREDAPRLAAGDAGACVLVVRFSG